MFEKFTDQARRVVVLAQEEARMLNHNYIGTEHLLLGVLHERAGVAARALEALGISLQAVRQEVEQVIGRGEQDPSGHIPFTPRAKKAMELAARESQAVGQVWIDTEHLLLGLVREGHGMAAQVLAKMGGDLDSVRQQVIMLAPHMAAPAVTPPRRATRERARLVDDALARIGMADQRLAAIERWVGLAPALDDLDREIAHMRREKESAIDRQDFESAAALRDKEKDLVDRRTDRTKEWEATTLDRLSVTAELSRLSTEIDRLRALLRQHGIDEPGEPA